MAGTRGSETAAVASQAEAIEKIAELTRAGNKGEILWIETKGLGAGLPDKVPLLSRPGSHGGPAELESLDDQLESYRVGPERREGTATVTTLKAFIGLVERHKDSGSVIFAKTNWPKPALTAVIDYHDAQNAPRHCRHRVHYAFPVTPEFSAWIALNGTPMDQLDFAHFLEEHAAELVPPDDGEKSHYERLFKATFAVPNELIDLSRGLEVHVGQRVKNAHRLQTGESEITFVEEHSNAAGEPIVVPGIFMIQLRAFVDGEPVRIAARLRYRASNGTIGWFYQLYRWEDELRERVAQDLAKAGKDTGLPTFEGAPEA